MIFMAKFPKKDDVTLEIVNSDVENEFIITLHDRVLDQLMSYSVEIEDLRLAIRKITAK